MWVSEATILMPPASNIRLASDVWGCWRALAHPRRGMLSLAAWVRLKFSGVSNASNCPLR